MQIADVPAPDRFELKALLFGGASGMAAGTTLWILDLVQIWSVLQAVVYAGCGGLAVRLLQRDGRRAPFTQASPAETGTVDSPAPPDLSQGAASARGAAEAEERPAEAREAAATLAQLDPFFSVTEQQLRSVVAQTEAAAGDILAALRTLDAVHARSASCLAATRGRMVGLAEDGDGALRALAGALNAYLHDRLESTRAERIAISGVGEQMRNLDALTIGLEKVGAATRMLALNANIEATRAGSHGAGFQVIARELQNLAQGSQEAIAEARRRVTAVQQTIDGVVAAASNAAQSEAEEARIQVLMADLDGIAERTTRIIAGMARTELTEIEALSGELGEQVLAVFGQIQFQDVVRQQIEAVGLSVRMLHDLLADLRQSLDGIEPTSPLRPDLLLEAVRANYVSQIQREADARAVGAQAGPAESAMIELF